MWVLDSGSELGLGVDSGSVIGSWDDSLADFDSAMTIGSVLGFGFGTGSANEGCFRPANLQSTEGNFQHYAHLGTLPLIVAKYPVGVTLDGFSTLFSSLSESSSSSPKSSSKSFDLLILWLG